MRLKGLSILKKVENRIKIDPLTVTQYVFEPLERAERPVRGAWQKHHIFAPPAGARSTIYPKLCVLIENVETIKKVSIIFRSNA